MYVFGEDTFFFSDSFDLSLAASVEGQFHKLTFCFPEGSYEVGTNGIPQIYTPPQQKTNKQTKLLAEQQFCSQNQVVG